uniref:Uncharacterized protein n=1 Tax=Oryza brachyantha TaxID=4533 RepID=J3L539_ORYBR
MTCRSIALSKDNRRHIFLTYWFTQGVWAKLRSWINVAILVPRDDEEDLTTWWNRARTVFRFRYRAAFDSLCLLVTWLIWKERNARMFNQVASTVDKLFNDIRTEVMIWREAGIFREGEG